MSSPVASLGRYFSRCAGVPNSTIGMVPMPTWAPKLTANEPKPTDRLGDQAGAGLVASQTAVGLGDIVAKQPDGSRFLQNRPHQARLFRLNFGQPGLNLAGHEIRGRLVHHPLLVGEHFRRQDRRRAGRLKQEPPTLRQRDSHTGTRSRASRWDRH